MRCPDDNLLARLLGGTLPPSEVSGIEAHLDSCDSCRHLVSELARGQTVAPGGSVTLGSELTVSDLRPKLSSAELIGTVQGEYRIVRQLGTGGMGIVYEAEHTLIGKRAAVKVLRTDASEGGGEGAKRLLDEARAVNAIRHRGIVDVFGFGELSDGRPYIVMELLEGHPLSAVVRDRGRLPWLEALAFIGEVLQPLAAAHATGVIHRDLKPSNIFVVEHPDGTRVVKLLDFGLAKLSALRKDPSHVTALVGTPDFMPPEQARGGAVTPQTDLYAIGAVLFFMLTGQRPFPARSLVEAVRMHAEEQPRRPSALAGDVPPELDALVLALLAKKPEDRPPSAEWVRQDVARMLAQWSEDDAAPALRAPPRRRWLAGLGLAAGLFAVAVALGVGPLGGLVAKRSVTDPPEVVRAPAVAGRPSTPVPSPPVESSAQEPSGKDVAATESPAKEASAKEAAAKEPGRPVRRAKEPGRSSRKDVALAPAADELGPRRADLGRRLGALEARVERLKSLGQPYAFQEQTVAVARRKLEATRTSTALDDLEAVVRRLERETP